MLSLCALLIALSGCKPVERCETVEGPDGNPSGIAYCYDSRHPERGAYDRTDRVLCAAEVRPACDPGADDATACASDEDCPVGEACASTGGACGCVRPCGNDNGCFPDTLCYCPIAGRMHARVARDYAECLPATCRDEFDCGGEPCGVYTSEAGEPTTRCRAEDDACRYDSDCEDDEICTVRDDAWTCARG